MSKACFYLLSDTMLRISPYLPTLGWSVVDGAYFETYSPTPAPGDLELSLLTKVDLTSNFHGRVPPAYPGATAPQGPVSGPINAACPGGARLQADH